MPIFFFLTHLLWIQLYFGFHKLSNFRMAIIIVNFKWACINTILGVNMSFSKVGKLSEEKIYIICANSLTCFTRSHVYNLNKKYEEYDVHLMLFLDYSNPIDGKNWHSSNMHYARKTTILFPYVFVTYVEIQTQTFIKAS